MILDWLAHFLRTPTMLGRRHGRVRWHHRIHLIPGSWLAAACDRYDRQLGVTDEELYRQAVSLRLAEDWDSPEDTAETARGLGPFIE